MTCILALDLASVTGWACGEPGGTPSHGSVRFASLGSSHEAIFAAALKWMSTMCKERQPGLVVWEAPLSTSFKRGKTTMNTTTLLYGLPAVIGAVAYLHGIYDIRKADTRDVRLHFLGQNPKRAKAKMLVMQQCRLYGWDVADDNEADALAIWSYMGAILTADMFRRRA